MLEKINPVLQNIANWFGDTWKELSQVEGFDGVMAVIKKKLTSAFESARDLLLPLFIQLKPAIKSAFESVIAFLRPYFEDVIDVISEKLNEWVYNLPGWIGRPFSEKPEDLALKMAVRKAQRELDGLVRDRETINNAVGGQENGANNSQNNALNLLATQIRDATAKLADAQRQAGVPVTKNNGTRHFGTSGVLGMISEPKDTTVDIQAGERVLNKNETVEYNSLQALMQSVNTNLGTMIALQRENNNQNRSSLTAMRDLNGNLFAT